MLMMMEGVVLRGVGTRTKGGDGFVPSACVFMREREREREKSISCLFH